MNILVGVGHPKQVHLWGNIMKKLEVRGHNVKFITPEKDIVVYLLQNYNVDYEIFKKTYNSIFKKAFGLIEGTFKALIIAKKFGPDIFISGTPYLVYVAKILNKPHITFSDTEHAITNDWLTYPFTNVVCTPSSFKKTINVKKHLKFDGFFELAYLHPKYFIPDASILNNLPLNETGRFIIIRFVDWNASHDVGQTGINNTLKKEYISVLSEYGQVFLSSESELSPEYKKYKLDVPPEEFHSVLSYAQLYIGEGGSTATEAALLGTPSIHVSTSAKLCGVFDDLLEHKLVYAYDDDCKALEKAVEILSDPQSKEKWINKRDNILKEKTDVAKFLTNFIDEYPKSLHRLME